MIVEPKRCNIKSTRICEREGKVFTVGETCQCWEMTDTHSEDVAPKQSGAQPDNNNAEKYKTPEERAAFLQRYIEHIKRGYSDESFKEYNSLKNYMERYPLEFATEKIAEARADRLFFWETIGIQGTVGKLDKFNSRSWEFNMQNRFRWTNRQDVMSDGEKIETPTMYIPKEEKD